jgi:hypothetical protein
VRSSRVVCYGRLVMSGRPGAAARPLLVVAALLLGACGTGAGPGASSGGESNRGPGGAAHEAARAPAEGEPRALRGGEGRIVEVEPVEEGPTADPPPVEPPSLEAPPPETSPSPGAAPSRSGH